MVKKLMSQVKISVIVPVYNVEKYLSECLDSLVHQTLEDIEIIIVNDGSTDNSQAIINKYVKSYPRKIKSLSKENGGLGDARNFGVPYATGEFIGFIDSDDYVDLDLYEKLYNIAIAENSEISVCDIDVFNDLNKKTLYVMNGLNLKDDLSQIQSALLSPLYSWNKIYNRSFFLKQNLKYPTREWYEDIPVTIPLFLSSRNISYVSSVYVHYRQREGSIMQSTNDPRLKDIFLSIQKLDENIALIKNSNNFLDEIEYLHVEHLVLYGGFRMFKSDSYKNLLKQSLEYLNINYPNWKKNKHVNQLKWSYRIYLKSLNKRNLSLWHKIIRFINK